jgi:hypothetical protein
MELESSPGPTWGPIPSTGVVATDHHGTVWLCWVDHHSSTIIIWGPFVLPWHVDVSHRHMTGTLLGLGWLVDVLGVPETVRNTFYDFYRVVWYPPRRATWSQTLALGLPKVRLVSDWSGCLLSRVIALAWDASDMFSTHYLAFLRPQ